MNSRLASRVGALSIAMSLAAALCAVPVAATADTTGGACEITGGTLSWGVKESFRSYISGSIANGSWETSDGADYETPEFFWSDATGSLDPATGTGSASFTGAVHFTGHDGVLDLTLANPTVEFDGGGAAALLLDARSTDMEREVSVDSEQEWVGDITVEDELAPSDGALELESLPAALTNSGAGAFAGFYEAGTDLDPLTLTLEFADCDATAPAAEASAPADGAAATGEAAAPQQAAPADIPWLPITVGGVALLVIGVTAGLLIGGRRTGPKTNGGDAENDAGGAS